MKTRTFFSIVFVWISIFSISVLWSLVKDDAFAQPPQNFNDQLSSGLPVLEVPMQKESSKWLGSFEMIPEQNVQQVIIVDPESQRIAVYHVDWDGTIHFKNVRHINADLKLRVHNAAYPWPQHIERDMLLQRQFNP